MAAPYTCPPLRMPDYYAEREYLYNLQTDEFVEQLEAQSWAVSVDLGIFEDGKYFLRLIEPTGTLRLMKHEIWDNTCCEGMPLHITLGYSRHTLNEQWLAEMVKGDYTLELKKWTTTRTSSTYLPRGELESLCEWLELYFGLQDDELHLSL